MTDQEIDQIKILIQEELRKSSPSVERFAVQRDLYSFVLSFIMENRRNLPSDQRTITFEEFAETVNKFKSII
jgi:hypothetical protein